MRTCTAYPASSVARRARVANVSQTAYAAHVHPLPPSRLHPSFCPRGKTEKDERPAGRVNKGPRTNGCKLKNGTTAASARLLFAESSRALSLSISYRLPFSILQPSFPFCCRHNLNLRRPDDTRETYVHRCHSILSPPPSLCSPPFLLLFREEVSPFGGSPLNFCSVSNFSSPLFRFFFAFPFVSRSLLTSPRPYCFWPRGGVAATDRGDVVI